MINRDARIWAALAWRATAAGCGSVSLAYGDARDWEPDQLQEFLLADGVATDLIEEDMHAIPAHRWSAARRLVRVRRMMHRYIWPAIDYAARAALAWFAFAGLFATLRGYVMPAETTIALVTLLALSALLVRCRRRLERNPHA